MDDSANSTDGLHGNAAYVTLMNEIRDGKLVPGDRLREVELAARLGVSRTPVREAIRQLEADGLVTHLPRQGASVRQLEYPEVMELYEMRAVLEGTAARLAARTASDVELAELTAINEDMRVCDSAEEAARLNRVFHAALLDASKNRFLHKSMMGLHRALIILGPTTLSQTLRFENAVDEHDRVLAALRARDGAAAETAMRAHIEAAQQVRMRALRATNPALTTD